MQPTFRTLSRSWDRGTVTRMNARTISVHCEPSERGEPSTAWRVAVAFVRQLVPVEVSKEALPEKLTGNLSGSSEARKDRIVS